jgi:hypothetical protein
MPADDVVFTGASIPVDEIAPRRKLPPGAIPLGWFRCEFAVEWHQFGDQAMAHLDTWISRNITERWASIITAGIQGTRIVLYFEDETDLVTFTMMEGKAEYRVPPP